MVLVRVDLGLVTFGVIVIVIGGVRVAWGCFVFCLFVFVVTECSLSSFV